MTTVILVVHLMLAIALIGVIMLQKSEGGALGIGGGGMSGFMTGRSTANLLTRATAVLAACFFLTSMALAYLAGNRQPAVDTLLTRPPVEQSQPAPAKSAAPAQPAAPAKPAAPAGPSAPLAK
ncbi:MAG TPA: preprotein translocase subunit SecG [Stellaceae bacterium]|nr:preprotein translocase subunit SecG [Stellaceae bacterium]